MRLAAFTPADWPALQAIVTPGHYLADRTMFDWAFRDSPANPSPGEYQFALAWDGERVVGYGGRMCAWLSETPCAWHETMYVVPEMRGQGIGAALHAWGAWPIVANLQGVHQPAIDRMLDKVFGEPRTGQLVRYIHRRPTFGTIKPVNAVSWPQAAALWARVDDRYGWATTRTLPYLAWRFAAHPRAHAYRLTGDVWAAAIYRIEDAPPHRGLRIVDLWGSSDGVWWVLRDLIALAADHHATFVDFLAWNSPDEPVFLDLGCERWTGDALTTIPLLFAPLDPSPRQETIRVYGLTDDRPMYVTRADDGRDRPQ